MELDDRGVILTCPACQTRNRLTFERLKQPFRCAHCKQALQAPDAPIDVTSAADFDSLIARASIPVVVDYWAPWCGPCRMVAPELKKVAARQSGRAIVVKVNTDQLSDLGERFQIRSIPTLALFAGGREVSRLAGARPAEEIERFIGEARP